MELKHTPGPWRIDWNISRLDIFADVGQLVARLNRGTKDGPPTYDDAEAIYNARLIAAAPDLLEALARLVPYAVSDQHEDDALCANAIDRAWAAISKATGA
jgi:hypothetical protein